MYKLEIQEKESKVKRIQDFISKEVNEEFTPEDSFHYSILTQEFEELKKAFYAISGEVSGTVLITEEQLIFSGLNIFTNERETTRIHLKSLSRVQVLESDIEDTYCQCFVESNFNSISFLALRFGVENWANYLVERADEINGYEE